jgi:site-specific DNA-methyltransferase (adenine-specific)
MTHLLPAFTGTPEVDRVYNVNCFTLMAALPNQSVDAYILDLPYGTTACGWDEIIPFAPMWAEVKRTLKPRGVFVTTASQPFTSVLIASNIKWFRHEWIIEKSLPTGHLNANKSPMKAHDNLVVFGAGEVNYYPQFAAGKAYRATSGAAGGYVRDKSTANYTTINEGKRFPRSVLRYSYDSGDHPTQKPVALYEYLIRTYTQAGELVVDFCCGSGTTALAARNTGRRFICGDITSEYVDIARQRLNTEFGGRKQKAGDAIDNLPLFQSISNSIMIGISS